VKKVGSRPPLEVKVMVAERIGKIKALNAKTQAILDFGFQILANQRAL